MTMVCERDQNLISLSSSFFFFKVGSQNIAQAGLEPTTILPQCWDYRYASLPCSAKISEYFPGQAPKNPPR